MVDMQPQLLLYHMPKWISIEAQESVARGHPRSATESYKKALKCTEFDEEEYSKGLHLPNVDFVFRTVEDVIQILYKEVQSIPRIPIANNLEETD